MRISVLLAAALIAGAPAVAQTKPAPAAAATSGTSTATPPPAHPITDAQAHELLHLSGADDMQKQMTQNMVAYLHHVMPPFTPADVISDIQTQLENADFNSQVVEIYKKHLSTEDAAAAIRFYSTPAGRRVVKAMPAIERESEMAGAKLGQQIAMQVIQAHKAEIQAAAQKYEQEHAQPDSPSPSPAPSPSTSSPHQPK